MSAKRFAQMVVAPLIEDSCIWHWCFDYCRLTCDASVPRAAKLASRMQRPPNHRPWPRPYRRPSNAS